MQVSRASSVNLDDTKDQMVPNDEDRKLGPGSAEIVLKQLDLMILDLYWLASSPKMQANINDRKTYDYSTKQDSSLDTLSAWLLQGPGMFLGLQHYQIIRCHLQEAGLEPLLNLVSDRLLDLESVRGDLRDI